MASADVAEEPSAGEGVGDEGDAAAAVSAVGTAEDVHGKGPLEEVGPSAVV